MQPSRILCVHERDAVLQDLEITLGFAGYEVVTAMSGREALRVIAKQHVDGVVLGYDVQGADGHSLRNQLRHFFPELPMLLFADVDEIRNIPLDVFRAYLEHPGPPAEILVAGGV